ncbi:flagellar hook protein FlgE [Campylobacter insulaenigrae]|nr:hypothetical protein [Campylobacter insulaenigrae]MCR6591960.1 hypothetical protein [Campylobacter insulaenigrae]MCR6592023.1 hypothetical protein [Campylobacter insulaenigrae]VEJ53275.1 flagellar hook protein FlgE [Campylobacter insulaenigrae]
MMRSLWSGVSGLQAHQYAVGSMIVIIIRHEFKISSVKIKAEE